MIWSRNIAMTIFLEHYDERAFSIVIKGDKEHCDDMGRELCDDSGHGVLGEKVSWNIVLTRAMELCDDTVLEHFDDKNSGAF